jgi:O-antigen ligase
MILYYLLVLIMRFHTDPRIGEPLFRVGVLLVTPVKIAGLFAIAGALLFRRPADAAPRLKNPLTLLFLAFAVFPLIVALAYGDSVDPDPVSSLLSLVLMLVATRLFVVSESRMFKVIRAIVVASTLASLWLYRQHFMLHMVRAEGMEGDGNYEALTLVIDIPLAIWMGRYDIDWKWRRIGLACALMMGTGVVLTQSRAGLLAVAAVGLVAILRSNRKLVTLTAAAIVAVLVFQFAPKGMTERFRHIKLTGEAENGDEESSRMHYELTKAGIRMVEAHPFYGVGLGQFKETAPIYNPMILQISSRSYIAHDTYVQIAAECGLPELLLFLMLIATGFFNLRAVKRLDDNKLSALANSMQLGLIGFCIAGASVSAVFVTTFWIMIFLSQNLREIASFATVPARRVSEAVAPARMMPRMPAPASASIALGQRHW